jgi:hypothetical protein
MFPTDAKLLNRARERLVRLVGQPLKLNVLSLRNRSSQGAKHVQHYQLASSSNLSTISSTTAVTPGTCSPISPGRSCPSRAAIGRAWVTQCEDWYNSSKHFWATESRTPLSVSDDTVYRALKELGFSHVSARPEAHKQDAEAPDAFKKTLLPAWRKSGGQNWLTEKLMSSDPSQGEAASVLYDLMPAHNPASLSDA